MARTNENDSPGPVRLESDVHGIQACRGQFTGLTAGQTYTEPTPIMLPFNTISELSRTLALAICLFGNMMSGVMIIAILLTIPPFLFPIIMTVLGLLTGMVQAYIFSILAGVYIAAATLVRKPKPVTAH